MWPILATRQTCGQLTHNIAYNPIFETSWKRNGLAMCGFSIGRIAASRGGYLDQ
jgi:hypothetical protein